jgi:serine/threonine protein kinase
VAGTLGDFRILREVGRGGMGVVYEAVQISLGRPVALKVLPFAAALDARQLQRFKNEAQAAAQLHHTNIVPVYAVGCERGVHFYAMQLIDGQTLAAVIADLRQRAHEGEAPADPQQTLAYVPGPCPAAAAGQADTPLAQALSTERPTRSLAFFRTAARLGGQAAQALEHAHQMGIIHRDVKPGNLMIDGRGNLWVTDFGLAHIQSDSKLTMTGDLLGTLRYMSPEQALGQRVVVDHRTDVYSLGATLYELLTLKPAFDGRDRQARSWRRWCSRRWPRTRTSAT